MTWLPNHSTLVRRVSASGSDLMCQRDPRKPCSTVQGALRARHVTTIGAGTSTQSHPPALVVELSGTITLSALNIGTSVLQRLVRAGVSLSGRVVMRALRLLVCLTGSMLSTGHHSRRPSQRSDYRVRAFRQLNDARCSAVRHASPYPTRFDK